jgi:hypothetical protein
MVFGRGEWARRPPILFALTCVGVGAIIVAGGWLTDARLTMHAALLVVGAVAFLPLVIMVVGLVVALLGLLVTALVAAAAEDADVAPVGELGAELMGAGAMATLPYYRRLFRMRRPAVWGGVAGLLLGAITLWGLLPILVIPHERETARRLAAAKVASTRPMPRTDVSPSRARATRCSTRAVRSYGTPSTARFATRSQARGSSLDTGSSRRGTTVRPARTTSACPGRPSRSSGPRRFVRWRRSSIRVRPRGTASPGFARSDVRERSAGGAALLGSSSRLPLLFPAPSADAVSVVNRPLTPSDRRRTAGRRA